MRRERPGHRSCRADSVDDPPVLERAVDVLLRGRHPDVVDRLARRLLGVDLGEQRVVDLTVDGDGDAVLLLERSTQRGEVGWCLNGVDRDGALLLGIEFRFNGKESIEFRGWGGNVQKAIEYSVMQRQTDFGFLTPPSDP